MAMRGERWRFWLPVVLLTAFAANSCQKLVRAHLEPEVKAPNYDIEYKIPAPRGSIYASYGKDSPLAMTVPLWEYGLDSVDLTNHVVRHSKKEPPRPKAAILKTIATALKLDYAKVKAMAETPSQYQRLTLSSDPEAHRILSDRTLVSGVSIREKPVRKYLLGRSMSHVIGAINAMERGTCGIELRYNAELTGTPGVVRGMKDANRREIYDRRSVSIDPKPGVDIYLTVEPNVQAETECALSWGLAEYGASTGWAIVMDAATGAIYAMASYPDFDPAEFGKTTEAQRLNRAVGFNFEPGSVMKTLTVAAAIDSNPSRFGPNTVYRTNRDDPDYYKLPGDGSHVWEPTMTLTHAIVHSSNIVIGKLAYDLGPKTLYGYFKRFGFGQKTGIELPGEQFGILPDPYKRMWDKASQSRAGIGQFVAVTPIQLISAYQSIANDGVRMRPYVVDRIVDAEGNVVHKTEPAELSRPISSKTAQTVRDMMLDVASPKGTARRAAIRGYSIAGKTGTAQKALNGHYLPGLYRASFCGIVPASEPRIVILASLDFNQKTLYHQGGNSAGPVFKRIALAAIRYLGIPPDRPDEVDALEDEYDKLVSERDAAQASL